MIDIEFRWIFCIFGSVPPSLARRAKFENKGVSVGRLAFWDWSYEIST